MSKVLEQKFYGIFNFLEFKKLNNFYKTISTPQSVEIINWPFAFSIINNLSVSILLDLSTFTNVRISIIHRNHTEVI